MTEPETPAGAGIPWKGALIAWFAMAATIFAGLGSFNLPTIARILRDTQTATGEITEKNCANHALAKYVFAYAGKRYSGGDSSINGDCEKLRIGDKAQIYFDASAPERNIARDPHGALWNELIPMTLSALFIPAITIRNFLKWRSRR